MTSTRALPKPHLHGRLCHLRAPLFALAGLASGCSLLLGPEPTFRETTDGASQQDGGEPDAAPPFVDASADGGGDGQPCNPNPCLNGGGCTRTGATTYRCDCDGTGYGGSTCEEPVVCDGATAPANGRVSAPSIAYPGAVTYSCDPGFVLDGDEEIRCTEAGTFAAPPPRCLAACAPLTRPAFGTLDREIGGEGQVATYGCIGRTLVGDRTRTCLPSGLWSGTAPECLVCTSSRWCLEAPVIWDTSAVWGWAPNDVWIADVEARMLHWDGRRLREHEAPERMRGVWGTSSTNVWAVGHSGAILRWDGTIWTPARSGTTLPLHAVSGTSGADVWAVGARGTAIHYDGSSWSNSPTGSAAALTGVWAASPTSAWAVGSGGTILRWDGAAWSPADSGTASNLTAIWGFGAADVWAVGADSEQRGVVLHWDGTRWRSVALGLGDVGGLYGLWGRASDDIWIGEFPPGGLPSTLHWNGSVWSRESAGRFGPTAFWGDRDDVWAFGSVIAHHTSMGWQGTGETSDLRSVWAGAGPSVWAVGDGGLRRRTGAEWVTVSTGVSDSFFEGVWGSAPSNLWSVGRSGIISWDGVGWRSRLSAWLLDVSGSSATNVWAVGRDGQSYHWNGSSWRDRETGTPRWLHAVWTQNSSEAWAVGEAGSIIRWNGTSWSAAESGTVESLFAVWGSSSTDVWAAGSGGAVLHWNGANWTSTTIGSTRFYGLWGTAANDVWLVGESSYHWDGSAWTPVTMPFATWIYAVWGVSATDVWAVGERGTILRYRP